MECERLGTSKVDPTGRVYIPKKAQLTLGLKLGQDYVSFEKDEKGCIMMFRGHLRFLRNNNNCKPKREESVEGGKD